MWQQLLHAGSSATAPPPTDQVQALQARDGLCPGTHRGAVKRAELLFGAIRPDIPPTPPVVLQLVTLPTRHKM